MKKNQGFTLHLWQGQKGNIALTPKKGAGLTLIELMVGALIITLLATAGLVAMRNMRAKARDAKRVYDISQYAKALRIYAQENNGQFPVPNGYLGRGETIDDELRKYFPALPADPLDSGGSNLNDYYYYYITDNICLGKKYPTVHGQNMETNKADYHHNDCQDGLGEGGANEADYLLIIN